MKYLNILILIFAVSCNKNSSLINQKIEFCNQIFDINEKQVICVNSKIKDLKPLIKLKQLEALDLTQTNVSDFNELSKFKSLKYLILSDTNFYNSKILFELKNLLYLNLDNTEIKTINFLDYLQKLKYLSIKGIILNNNLYVEKFLKRSNIYFVIESKNLNSKLLENQNYFKSKVYANYKFYKPLNNNIILSDSKDYLISNYNEDKFKKNILSSYPDLVLSSYNKKSKKLILWSDDYNYFKFININALVLYKALEKLVIYLKNDNKIKVLSKLKNLKELYLIGKNIRNINLLPIKLKKLYLYNTRIVNFDFLKKCNLKYLEIVTTNFKDKRYYKLKKKYPFIEIKIKDFYLNSQELFNITFMKWGTVNNLDSLYFNPKNAFKSRSDISEKYKHIELPNDFRYQSLLWEFQNYLRNLIHYKEIDGIILTNNKEFIIHILKNYEFDLNQIDKYKQTLLDRVIGIVDNDIISIIRKHGAKRGCEILKTKCEALSPEIEKILKNNNKTKGDK